MVDRVDTELQLGPHPAEARKPVVMFAVLLSYSGHRSLRKTNFRFSPEFLKATLNRFSSLADIMPVVLNGVGMLHAVKSSAAAEAKD